MLTRSVCSFPDPRNGLTSGGTWLCAVPNAAHRSCLVWIEPKAAARSSRRRSCFSPVATLNVDIARIIVARRCRHSSGIRNHDATIARQRSGIDVSGDLRSLSQALSRWVARISHQWPAAAPDPSASAALRLVGLLNSLASGPPSPRTPGSSEYPDTGSKQE